LTIAADRWLKPRDTSAISASIGLVVSRVLTVSYVSIGMGS
jgi:hypothetical protein